MISKDEKIRNFIEINILNPEGTTARDVVIFLRMEAQQIHVTPRPLLRPLGLASRFGPLSRSLFPLDSANASLLESVSERAMNPEQVGPLDVHLLRFLSDQHHQPIILSFLPFSLSWAFRWGIEKGI